MFNIQSQLLAGTSDNGREVAFEASPNINAHPIVPKFLVFHYTACSFDAARRTFLDGYGANRVSAHLLVDEDGSVVQFVPFNQRAWHAGTSFWRGFTDLNSHSIGIEVVNHGYLLRRADGGFTTSDGSQQVSADRVVEVRHKNTAEPHRYWHAYTSEQIETCAQLAQLLVASFGLSEVVGHDDIAPERKVDPGPAFPMRRMTSRAIGRAGDDAMGQRLFVSADRLNLRSGPGVQYQLVRAPLVQNTMVIARSGNTDGWLQVEAEVSAPNIGWVASGYLRSAPLVSAQ
ncbi:N-acetylmuramoyl-L-alanine amidase [Ideonella sp. 4Y11]|uniref:N-acetylmuramoyl-L-alanine amidase n=1 Tax=Ideonella aquatica TaxID=2824119 RepID=A0A940YMX0_9BURK|nr:N-acetylmuramoyl-L-alanine amidase [Ideonella aquatica]MBQ0961532.1 N-acetylmuramoyl-L-alanine amidase [Ideonella aquatica]